MRAWHDDDGALVLDYRAETAADKAVKARIKYEQQAEDLRLIQSMVDLAVESALEGTPGVIGHDEDNGDVLSVIAFDRIAGGKPFDISQQWYLDLLTDIGQPAPVAAPPAEH